jgi:hypothetical protein
MPPKMIIKKCSWVRIHANLYFLRNFIFLYVHFLPQPLQGEKMSDWSWCNWQKHRWILKILIADFRIRETGLTLVAKMCVLFGWVFRSWRNKRTSEQTLFVFSHVRTKIFERTQWQILFKIHSIREFNLQGLHLAKLVLTVLSIGCGSSFCAVFHLFPDPLSALLFQTSGREYQKGLSRAMGTMDEDEG